MNLDTINWKEFNVGKLFACSTTAPILVTEAGKTPYVTRSALNNGVSDYVSEENDMLNKGNCITIGAEGRVAFYQNNDFVAGIKVYVLRHQKLNQYNALFVCTVLNVSLYKYSYGRARILQKIEAEIIKLPVDSDGSPNWAYMEKYIKTLHHKPITTTIKQKNIPPLDIINWEPFLLDDLFTFHKGCRLTKQDMIDGQINFLGAISENNGVRQKIDVEPMYKPNCITVNYNGSVGEAFYQPSPFWASDDVNVLYAKGWTLNKHIAMFIATVIKANRYKFSYGRKWTLDKMKKSAIKLPVTTKGSPNWDYMEKYIKSLPYSDRI